MTSTNKNNMPVDIFGINYEGGDIIKHILKYKQCIAYANIQIVKNEPCELLYYESRVIEYMYEILTYITKTYTNTRIVIQITVVKEVSYIYNRIIKPVLKELNLLNGTVAIIQGHTKEQYYKPAEYDKRPFVFINYGMFSLLNKNDEITTGTIFNPIYSYPIVYYDAKGFIFSNCPYTFLDEKNILIKFPNIKFIHIFNLHETLPEYTSTNYKREHIDTIIEDVLDRYNKKK